jgi:hypothetical protein
MKKILRASAPPVLALLLLIGPARAADAVFPPGARVGLVPADGLTVATEFLGFETEDKKTKVGIAEIPSAAFTAVDTAVKEGKTPPTGPKAEKFETAAGSAYITTESGKDGNTNVRSYSLIVPGSEVFSGYVIAQTRDDAAKPLSDEAMRKMLASATIRKDVPVAEQLGLLPFKVNELSNFKTIRTLTPRSTVLLTDGTEETTLDGAPYMVIGLITGVPDKPEDRGRFAQQTATTIPGLRDARITSNEPLRIESTPGFETRIDAVTGKNDTPITVVQWLRFGGGSALRIIASATREEWPKAFPRFRAVRDGIDPR